MGNHESRLQRQNSNPNFLMKPITEKHSCGGRATNFAYALTSMQGWRAHMEDAHILAPALPGVEEWAFFAVLDGHAGKMVADVSAATLLSSVAYEVLPVRDSSNAVCEALGRSFLRHDRSLQTNFDVLRDRSGATCTSVLISPSHIFFANCGDSRAILCRGGQVVYATEDHKPTDTPERDRIQRAGGYVINGRVDGGLAVSRAFGDFEYKMRTDLPPTRQKVSAQADVHAEVRQANDDFVLLACDGVWDVFSSVAAAKFISMRLRKSADLENICERLVRRCLELGSRDNISVLLIAFDKTSSARTTPAPEESPEQVASRIGASIAVHVIQSSIAHIVNARGTSVVNREERFGFADMGSIDEEDPQDNHSDRHDGEVRSAGMHLANGQPDHQADQHEASSSTLAARADAPPVESSDAVLTSQEL